MTQTLNKELSKLEAILIDAPVSGGELGSINGKLISMVGSDNKKAYEETVKYFDLYCKMHKFYGKSGSGQIIKMGNFGY